MCLNYKIKQFEKNEQQQFTKNFISDVEFQNNKKNQIERIKTQYKYYAPHLQFENHLKQSSHSIQQHSIFQHEIKQMNYSQKNSYEANQKSRKYFVPHRYQQSFQTNLNSFKNNSSDLLKEGQSCYVKSQGNIIIINPKNISHLFNDNLQRFFEYHNVFQNKFNNSRNSTQNTKKKQQNFNLKNNKHNNIKVQQDQKSLTSQPSQQSLKQIRFKKTIFKAHAFLKNKNQVSQKEWIPQKTQQSHNNNNQRLKSMPKNFKSSQPIYPQENSGIHKYFKQKLKQSNNYKRKECLSTEKNKTNASSQQNKFLKYYRLNSLNVNQSIPMVFQKGRQLFLKFFHTQNQNIYANLKIIKVLAENGPSCVYLVVQKQTSFLYCLKKTQIKSFQELSQKNTQNPRFQTNLESLIRESKIGMSLGHPFLIKTYCTLYDDKNIYQLMQFVQGSNLQNLHFQRKNKIASQNSIETSIHPIKAIRQILVELIEAIVYLHDRKIVHRDLKPANIFISNNHAFKIGDFGCSIYDQPNDFVGTLDYVAPQIMLHEPHGTPVDMWAIGCIAYELYVGKPPFFHLRRKDTIQRIVQGNYNLDKIEQKFFKDLIQKLLQRNPEKRPTVRQAFNHIFLQQTVGQYKSQF